MLFSSGVGYFEHFGTVKGDGTAELRFKTDQINDVLKSLVLQDLDKGQVGTVTYPSQEPLAKTLKSFQVDITTNPPLADLLNQLRGAKITADAGRGRSVNGTIVGVEKQRKAVGAAPRRARSWTTWLLNLKVGHKFRSIAAGRHARLPAGRPQARGGTGQGAGRPGPGARPGQEAGHDQLPRPGRAARPHRLRRRDAGLEDQLPADPVRQRDDQAPATRAGAPAAADRGQAARPAPAHATRPGKLPGEGNLQGWAIVENQTDNDWNDVQLSLVSGRPISYIQDLYHPLFIPRPVVFPDLYMSLRPQTYQGGISDEEQEKMNKQREAAGNNMASLGAAASDEAVAVPAAGRRRRRRREAAASSATPAATPATSIPPAAARPRSTPPPRSSPPPRPASSASCSSTPSATSPCPARSRP